MWSSDPIIVSFKEIIQKVKRGHLRPGRGTRKMGVLERQKKEKRAREEAEEMASIVAMLRD